MPGEHQWRGTVCKCPFCNNNQLRWPIAPYKVIMGVSRHGWMCGVLCWLRPWRGQKKGQSKSNTGSAPQGDIFEKQLRFQNVQFATSFCPPPSITLCHTCTIWKENKKPFFCVFQANPKANFSQCKPKPKQFKSFLWTSSFTNVMCLQGAGNFHPGELHNRQKRNNALTQLHSSKVIASVYSHSLKADRGWREWNQWETMITQTVVVNGLTTTFLARQGWEGGCVNGRCMRCKVFFVENLSVNSGT